MKKQAGKIRLTGLALQFRALAPLLQLGPVEEEPTAVAADGPVVRVEQHISCWKEAIETCRLKDA